MNNCKIGKITWKSNVVGLSVQERTSSENMFLNAINLAKKKEVSASGYFIMTKDGTYCDFSGLCSESCGGVDQLKINIIDYWNK
jgi:hypothetical protein